MLRHKNIDRVCCIVLTVMLLLSTLFVGAAAGGLITEDATIGYETRLFDQSRVHTIDIVMQDWEAFLDTATSEEYASCHLVIDGESYKNVAIRGKGNTSLSSVQAYGNNRYSFKVEFDHYQTGATYHGLDKLSLNNLIQDNTYMKDYFAYTLMNKMGVAAPLCSFVQISVNGEPWGLYLAVEGVEDAFLQRSYGKDHGELYKPDSMSFGGGRGNGGGFDMEKVMEEFDFSFPNEDDNTQASTMPSMGGMQTPGGFDPNQPGGFGGPVRESAPPSGMPVGGEIPETGDAPAMPADGMTPGMGGAPAMPADGMTPGMGGAPAMPSDGESAGTDGRTTIPTGRSRMQQGMGGGMGMGSEDVKLQYIDDDPSSYSNIFNNAKTDITEADQLRLIASLKALNEGDASVVDTDAVIRYMAVHNFLCNDDSYTGMMVHNYYLYEEDGVLAMIPWDYNLAYGTMNGSNATSSVNAAIDTLVTGGSGDRPMASWITASAEYTAQYRAAYEEFMTAAFDSGWFEEEIDRVTAMISPYVQSDPTAFCTYEEFLTGAETLKQFCLRRAQSIANQLNGDDARVDASDLDLSAMGTMGNMGGPGGDRGGFDRSNMDFGGFAGRPDNGAGSAMPPEGGNMGMPTFDRPSNMPENAAKSPDALARQAAAPTEEAAESDRRASNPFDHAFDFTGMNRQEHSNEGWIWLGLCTALLCAALAFAALRRNPR